MPTITDIENALLNALKATGAFTVVESIGRSDVPDALAHPAAFVYFVSDTDTRAGDEDEEPPLPVDEVLYDVIVQSKNLISAEAAAQDSYGLLDTARDAIHGKTLGLTRARSFRCLSRVLAGYENGVISYRLRMRTEIWRAIA